MVNKSHATSMNGRPGPEA